MKDFILWFSRKLFATAQKHKSQIIIVVTTVLKYSGGVVLGHFSVRHGVLEWWQWIAEPIAGFIVGVGGYLWSAWMKRQADRHAVASTRIAYAAGAAGVDVSQVTHADIAAVPDSISTDAQAKVTELNKNGGVPAPPKA